MSFRIIALDLDGTLLDNQKHILPQSLAALAEAQAAGIQVVIVTGRHHVAIHPFYQALNLTTPAICCNGSYLYDYQNRSIIDGNPLSSQQANQVLDLMQTYNIDGLLYVDHAMIYQKPNGHVDRSLTWASTLPAAQRPVFEQTNNLRHAASQAGNIWKFATSHADVEHLQRFANTVTQQLDLEAEWSWHDQVDIAQAGNSKGQRLQQWVESQGLSMDQVIAFGDNHNDISMLTRAGLGVAMGNSEPEVQAQADLVIGANTTSAIADLIRERVLAHV